MINAIPFYAMMSASDKMGIARLSAGQYSGRTNWQEMV
jgi:hypothetical protein